MKNNACEYCSYNNKDENLRGSDGVVIDVLNEPYLYIEHFRNEIYKIKVNYCPECGRKLKPL